MIHKKLKVNSDTVSKNYIGKILEIIAFTKDEELEKDFSKRDRPTFNALSLEEVLSSIVKRLMSDNFFSTLTF